MPPSPARPSQPIPPPAPLTLAAAQFTPAPGDVAGNAARSAALVRAAAAAGARLVVFPELSLLAYDLDLLGRPESWVTADDPRLAELRRVCRETGTTAVVGGAWRGDDGLPRLASLALRPDGTIDAAPKVHLHGAERDSFVPAAGPTVLDVEGWRIGLAVCFDAAVPEHARAAARLGMDVYAVSALYTRGEERRLDLHLGARAMDHRVFSVLANLGGAGRGWTSCGLSGSWGPRGERRLASGGEDILVLDTLDPGDLLPFRRGTWA